MKRLIILLIFAGSPMAALAGKKPAPTQHSSSANSHHSTKTPVKKTPAEPAEDEDEVSSKHRPHTEGLIGPQTTPAETTAVVAEISGSTGTGIPPLKSPHGRPAVIATTELADFESLPSDRKNLIEGAIATARDSGWLPYKFGGNGPADGGFDCSGAMCYVMGKAGLKPPRTSADQYNWLKERGRLHEVSENVRDLGDSSLAALKPGDLLFWSGTYAPTDGRTANITHVAMYLGKEKKGGKPVMINATDGRSYHGTQANGYGVYDFYLPKEGGKSKFVGYGTPIGIAEMPAVDPAK